MEKIHIVDAKELIETPIPIGVGFTANCYKTKDDRIIKLYRKHFSDAIEVLSRKSFTEDIERLSEIKTESFITPEVLVVDNDEIRGYICKRVHGVQVKHLSSNTKVTEILSNMSILLQDIKTVSNARVCLYDITGRNVMFDGQIRVIDLDRSEFDLENRKSNLQDVNTSAVVWTVVKAMFGIKSTKDGLYRNVDINYYRDHTDLDTEALRRLLEELKDVCKKDEPTLRDIRRKVLSKKIDDKKSEYTLM